MTAQLAESDLLLLDNSSLGPNGEKPWVPAPMPTVECLIDQYKLAAKNREIIVNDDYNDMSEVIGENRELTPCPRNGKITFRQIGDLRLTPKDIALDNEDLLICRKPVFSGELDNKKNPIYRHEDPTFDPSDFYQAFWGHKYKVYRGSVLPMNPLDSWNEGFSGPYPADNDRENNGFDYRGVEVVDGADGKHFRVYSKATREYVYLGSDSLGYPVYDYVYFPEATFCNAYVGRLPAGTRLEWYVEISKSGGNSGDQSGFFQIRGFSEGFFGGEDMIYNEASIWVTSGWESFSGEITVDDRFSDLWLAFQINGSDSNNTVQNINFRNFQIWRA